MRVGRRRGMLRRVPLLSHVRLGVDTMGMVAPVYYTADMVPSLPADRFTKRRLYQERSVPTYLVVDGDARQVEVWTPEAEFPVLERERLMWLPTGAERTFTLELNELFRAI